ncbi:molybdenum cofactor sulfurase isoform X2 [Clupea harengus]|uniref:Molybdenum cofactor sulfurase n=1 Tax=Clupea harengus TaxID=7950 RepID=A0A8M1KS87_CLUHA|nr:molybdenum cofactor sulfurase isoform X2 [Clupea harengus]
MELQDIFTFQSFHEIWGPYGYGYDLPEMIEKEFGRMKGITYLDHGGTTLFPESQIKAFYQDLTRNIYGNPHSHNLSSRLTHDTVEHVRYRVLEHFNTSPEEHTVIFTSGCTAALKLVAESFPWSSACTGEPGSHFCYLTDNHTSVVGIRGVSGQLGVTSLPVSPHEVEARARHSPRATSAIDSQTAHLFCYPAQSNFSGRKYPLSYARGIQTGRLYPACERPGRWLVLLDAAALVGSSGLDLQENTADFIPISFYKMFGFPTGLGALLVRNEAAAILRKGYFGGGTAAAYLAGEDYFVPKSSVSSRFEDGTISFLDVISVHHGFEALQRLTGGMVRIQQHTFGLARYSYVMLSSLLHSNGQPVAHVYCDNEFQDPSSQGAVLNFNVLDGHGGVVGYSQVDKLASLFNIHIRTGCFCNTGACQVFLGISNQEVKDNLEAGHVCGDSIDLVDGRPTGSVRVSFGYMSTFEDCQKFLSFIVNCFTDKPFRMDEERLARLKLAVPFVDSVGHFSPSASNGQLEHKTDHRDTAPSLISSTNGREIRIHTPKRPEERNNTQILTNIFIYPIKSCAAFEVREWSVGPLGLLHDRTWMVVNENGVCLSQKREPTLGQVQPRISLASNALHITAPGMNVITVPLGDLKEQNLSQRTCQSKVCGDRVQTVDCGDEVASWFSEFLGKPCRLMKQKPDFIRNMKKAPENGDGPTAVSLVNEAQYLLISRASVEMLQERISGRLDDPSIPQAISMQQLIARFRANLVVTGTNPLEEDDWSGLTIGNTGFRVAGRCGRCQMIGIDQESGARTQEPLKSLSDCRQGKVTFGIYLLQQPMANSSAITTLSVGSPIAPELSKSDDY